MLIEKIKKGLDSTYYLLGVVIAMIIFWAIPYTLLEINILKYQETVKLFENIALILIGVFILLTLSFYENIFYIVPIIVFVPFMFSHSFDVYTTPKCIYVAIGLLILGLIIHFIRFKPKFKRGHFLLGISLLGITMITGGIGFKEADYFANVIIVAGCAIGMVFVYLLLSSTVKVEFEKFALLMTCLGLYLTFQLLTYYLLQDSIIKALSQKLSNVGWGISNNIALMLLVTIPFTTYLCYINTTKKCLLYYILAVIQMAAVVLTYSRGALLAMIVGIVIMVIIGMKMGSDKKLLKNLFLITTALVILFVVVLCISSREIFEKMMALILDFDFKDGNNRFPIYKTCLEKIKHYPIFGCGMLSCFDAETGQFMWAHSTILHTTTTMGLVGTIALIYHMFEKYYYFFKKAELWKLMVILSLGMSDLYGMIDVSYYFINYMVLMIVILSVVDFKIEDKPLFSKTEVM